MRLYLLFLIGAILFSSCNSEYENFNGEEVGEFPKPILLNGSQILEDEKGIIYLKMLDSLLVLSTQQDTLIHVYDKRENYIAGFGRKGRGPNEFSKPPFIMDATNKKLFALDEQLLTWSSINLMKSIDSSKVIIDRKIEFPKELNGASDIFYIDTTTIIGTYDDHFYKQLDERRGGFYYSPNSEQIKTFSLHNLKIEPFEVMAATNINARNSAISPDRQKFATLMMYYPGLEIFNIGSNAITRYLLDSNPPNRIFNLETFKKDDYTEFYNFVDVTNDYIYMLYSGYTFNDTQHESYIQVIDWAGDPIAQYQIPAEYNLSLFAVDEKNNCIYGLSYANDAIYKFNHRSVPVL